MVAVCTFINKTRIAKGWGVLPAADAEITAAVYIEVFDRYNVPASAYLELYDRANDTRIKALSEGKQPQDITPELMVAGWIGNNGLRAELAERERRKRPQLSENAGSICPNCYGTGLRYVKDSDGRTLGVSGVCDHKDE